MDNIIFECDNCGKTNRIESVAINLRQTRYERCECGVMRRIVIHPQAAIVTINATEPMSEQIEANLAMLVRRLVSLVKRKDPNSKTAAQAIDYLNRKGLQGSMLRESEPPLGLAAAKNQFMAAIDAAYDEAVRRGDGKLADSLENLKLETLRSYVAIRKLEAT